MQAPAKRLPRGLSRATPQVVQMYWSFIEESVKSLWVVRDSMPASLSLQDPANSRSLHFNNAFHICSYFLFYKAEFYFQFL